MKQKFIEAHMRTAENYAELSSARRLKVGCVIVKNDTIIGIGYNGMPSGWDNNCEKHPVTPHPETFEPVEIKDKLITRPEVLHAETNAIAKVSRSTNSSEGATAFVTHAPCLDCAKILYQAGINSVFYRDQYRSVEGIEFLEKCGINVEQVSR